LNKGDWVEFHYEDGTFRWARLGWVSGMKNTYLFSDRDGMSSFSISLHRLADKLRRGEAVLVERRSITETAFGKLMNLFRNKLGYVLRACLMRAFHGQPLIRPCCPATLPG
jgi:hypothetical protein